MNPGEREVRSAMERKKILFVDDKKCALEDLRRILREKRETWKLLFATSVGEAIDVLMSTEVDVVVTEINMPERDGFDLIRTLRDSDRTWNIPVVFLSGTAERQVKRRALEYGAADMLSKPIEAEDLIARLNNVLRLKSYQDQIENQNRLLEERVQMRTSELERSRVELVWRLGRAGEFRDSETGYHVMRVGFFSRQLGSAMGLDDGLVRHLFLTSPLHDIGKIGVPDHILRKEGPLDEKEWETMRAHTTIGACILRENVMSSLNMELGLAASWAESGDQVLNPLAQIAADIAEFHHERWDGNGYPQGLEAEDIPLPARITSVADVYDALCSARPYKLAFSEDRAIEVIRSEVGAQFDPDVIRAFERSVDVFSEIRSAYSDGEEAAHRSGSVPAPDDIRRAS